MRTRFPFHLYVLANRKDSALSFSDFSNLKTALELVGEFQRQKHFCKGLPKRPPF